MFSKILSTAILAAVVVRADVNPTTPGGSDIYREGETCSIEWTGDTTGAWADMAIQLMSGDNFQMVPVTTITTGQDGNKDGSFEYVCPEVTPNSLIYFYQFTAPGAPNTTWTTRWTLAGADGSTTAPANDTQPDGAVIGWGVGALDDAAAVVPPPTFAAAGASGSGTSVASGASTATTSIRVPPADTTSGVRTATRATTSDDSESTSTRSSSGNASQTSDDADGAMAIIGSRSLQAFVASSLVFAFFL